MSLVKHEVTRRERPLMTTGLFDRFFDDGLGMFRHPVLLWPEAADTVRVEEFEESGELVVRAELAGIDPEKDVEITVEGSMLRIAAERREQEQSEGRDYVRQEIRYGSFTRTFTLPEGVTETDVKATYKDGILEVRVPLPKRAETVKVPVMAA